MKPSQLKDASQPLVRCAVYTRKSSEEGLQQEFNSLDAQMCARLDWIWDTFPRACGLASQSNNTRQRE